MVWQRGRGRKTNRRNVVTGAATLTICSNVRLTSYSPSVVSHSHSAADAVGWHCSGSHSSYCTNTRSVTYLFSPPTARSEALRYQRTHSHWFSSQTTRLQLHRHTGTMSELPSRSTPNTRNGNSSTDALSAKHPRICASPKPTNGHRKSGPCTDFAAG